MTLKSVVDISGTYSCHSWCHQLKVSTDLLFILRFIMNKKKYKMKNQGITCFFRNKRKKTRDGLQHSISFAKGNAVYRSSFA